MALRIVNAFDKQIDIGMNTKMKKRKYIYMLGPSFCYL